MHGDLVLGEPGQRPGIDVQPEVHTLGQDDGRGAMGEDLFHRFRLDAGYVPGTALCPVPRSATAGVELEVLPDAQAFDVHAPPCDVQDARRALTHAQSPCLWSRST